MSDNKFKIEKGVPMPSTLTRDLVNALLRMGDGDSVFISKKIVPISKVRSCISNARIRRKIKDDGFAFKSVSYIEGVRIWCIKK